MPKSGVNEKVFKTIMPDFDIEKIKDAVVEAIEKEAEERNDKFYEEISKMMAYLPELFVDNSEERYLQSLWLAVQTSIENDLYQFAYIQYHMLFMTAVYYVLLKVSVLRSDGLNEALYYLLKDRFADFKKPSNTKGGKLYFGSFAIINESDVFMLLRVIGLKNDLLGELQKLVEERNQYAHANGQLQLTSDELLMEKIEDYNKRIEQVFGLLKPLLIELYKDTITQNDFYDPDIRAYIDPDEQIKEEFVRKYSLSRVEINWLRKIKTSDFEDCDGYENVKELHIALMHYYDEIIGKYSSPIEDPYFAVKYKNHADEFIENVLGISAYECVKDGGEFPVYECPDCGEKQFAYDAENGKYHCFSCNVNYSDEELSRCSDCNRLMKKDEIDLCPDCIEYRMEKD